MSERPTEFRGCIWDDGWEFDAPCVVYYPSPYARFGIGNNNSRIDRLVEDICYDIARGRPHTDEGLGGECAWRGWGRRGFARRKTAEHVVIKVRWDDDGWAEIISRDVTIGPPALDGSGEGRLLTSEDWRDIANGREEDGLVEPVLERGRRR